MPKSAKKPSRKRLITRLDVVFSKYVRLSNADRRGYCTCVTCGKQGYWEKDIIDAGHFISRSHMATRWDPENVLPQCSKCNRFQSGRQFEFAKHLGYEKAEELLKKSREIKKFSLDELKEMIDFYSDALKKLE